MSQDEDVGIAIVGAGLGGLALALALHRHNEECERQNKRRRTEGSEADGTHNPNPSEASQKSPKSKDRQLQPIPFALFDRDDQFEARRVGYGLTLTYNEKGPLAYLGLLDDIARARAQLGGTGDWRRRARGRAFFQNARGLPGRAQG